MKILRVLFCFSLLLGSSFVCANPWNAWRDVDKYAEVNSQLKRNIENSGILTEFRNQTETKNQASQELHKSIQAILKSNNSDQRERYREFLTAYRKSVVYQLQNEKSGGNNSDLTAKAIRQLGKIFYNGTDITEFNSRLTCTVAQEGIKKIGSTIGSGSVSTDPDTKARITQLRKMIGSLTIMHSGIKANRQISLAEMGLQSWIGAQANAGFDPNMQANLLSIKTKYTNEKTHQEVLSIRMPSQTIFSSENEVTIAPEFEMYLNALQSDRKKHTYINHQQLIDEQGYLGGAFGDEKYRARKIHDLSAKYSNLIVISLNKNSSFYRQNKTPPISRSFKDFKEEYLEILVPKSPADDKTKWKETGIRLDDLWNPAKFEGKTAGALRKEAREYFNELLDQIGSSIFGVTDPSTLISASDRQALIELSYHFISDYASRDAHSFNRSCKDGIDRGGAANALAYTITFLKEICDSGMNPGLKSGVLNGREDGVCTPPLCPEGPHPALKGEVSLSSMNQIDFQKGVDAIPGMIFSDALQVRKREIIEERLVYFQNAIQAVIQAVERNSCEKVFGKKDGKALDPFFYMSNPRFSSKLQSKPTDERLQNACSMRSLATPVVDGTCPTSLLDENQSDASNISEVFRQSLKIFEHIFEDYSLFE